MGGSGGGGDERSTVGTSGGRRSAARRRVTEQQPVGPACCREATPESTRTQPIASRSHDAQARPRCTRGAAPPASAAMAAGEPCFQECECAGVQWSAAGKSTGWQVQPVCRGRERESRPPAQRPRSVVRSPLDADRLGVSPFLPSLRPACTPHTHGQSSSLQHSAASHTHSERALSLSAALLSSSQLPTMAAAKAGAVWPLLALVVVGWILLLS